MHYALNEATTMNVSFEDDIVAYSQAGWTAAEIWLAKVDTYLQSHSLQDARNLLDDHGIRAAGACAGFIEVESEAAQRGEDFELLRRRFEMCQALGTDTLTVVVRAGGESTEATYQAAYERLADACDQTPDGLRLALEFIANRKPFGSLSSAIDAVQQVNSPKLGITLDLFHLYAGVSKVEDIAAVPAGKLFMVHVDDARVLPRELWTDADRVLPGEGVMPLAQLHAAVRAQGYDGFYSLELFNRELWDRDPYAVAQQALAAIQTQFP